jgi:hypothetical protein
MSVARTVSADPSVDVMFAAIREVAGGGSE